ncbi:MAG: DUF6468 domain-containing protein [Alphaproteobacteria bacterium]|nr:DUF6468 domain-containing protein [Alphaproteobacteria bacterium]
MMELLYLLLDALLIGLLITGIVYAVRLNRQLAQLRSSRADMERFVVDFSGTVARAETGIKGLKQAARDCGDDLEHLIDKAHQIRDELQFLTESADQIATRLSQTAITATSSAAIIEETQPPAKVKAETPKASAPKPAVVQPTTAAERDLLQALEKIG